MTPDYLIRGIGAETLKIKRSLALVSALLIPLLPPFINFMMTMQRGIGKPALGISSPWSTYFMSSIKLWVIFALPLVLAVLSALLANVEHRHQAWKVIFALPFPRQAIIASKWLALAGIILLSTLVFSAANLASGVLVYLLRPEPGMDLPIPVLEAFTRPFIAWLLSLFMVSIHLWISLRWSSFLTSVTVGFAASISNIFLISSSLYTWSAFSPWAMPVLTYDRWGAGLLVSLAGAVLTYLLAKREFVRRDVY